MLGNEWLTLREVAADVGVGYTASVVADNGGYTGALRLELILENMEVPSAIPVPS